MSGIKTVFGGATISKDRAFHNAEDLKVVLQVLKEYGVSTIDSAQIYGESEAIIGEAKAGQSFTIDTKVAGGFRKGSPTKDNIIQSAKESLEKLGLKKVHIYYIHAPDDEVPLSETLAGINEVYKSGAFERFGLSNFKAEDVEKVYRHCEEKGYVKPSVYQGNYSPVARKQEEVLFPTLRKLGLSFYAYSPLAGGFLTKTKQQVEDGAGRFDKNTPIGKMYSTMYGRPAYFDALEKWGKIAEEAGISRADLAYRWVKYNSSLKPEHDDAIIVGASSLDQLKQTLQGVNAGPLSADVVKKIDQVWETIKHEAPLDNYHG